MKYKKVGVLAIQGSFAEHGNVLRKMGVDFVWVRDLATLKGITHLIIPGGESTTMTKLLKEFGMWDFLQLAIRLRSTNYAGQVNNKKLAILGTCAGAILISRLFSDVGFTVDRNAYGGQQSSFITKLESSGFTDLEEFLYGRHVLKMWMMVKLKFWLH